MTSSMRVAAALAIAAWSATATGFDVADESGTFSMVRVSITDYTAIDHGDGSAVPGQVIWRSWDTIPGTS